MASAIKLIKFIFVIFMMLVPVSGISGCGSVEQEKTEQKEIHVSARSLMVSAQGLYLTRGRHKEKC